MKNIAKPGSDTKWHRLDNTATVFPVISNKTFSSVYRISVRLMQDVDPEILQRALDVTIPWFDSFLVRMHHGFFWYYFESNRKRPIVTVEKTSPCGYIDPVSNSSFLFRVIYYKKRISLEVFHALSDGTVAINFIKELTLCYLRLMNTPENEVAQITLPIVEVTADSEDSYLKNYKKSEKSPLFSEKSYQIKGEKLPLYSTGVIHGYLKVDELLACCRKRGVTITQYLAAVLIWSIFQGNMNRQPSKHPVKLYIPVNLRPFFDSTSTMNFFSSVSIGYLFTSGEPTFDEVLSEVCQQYKSQMSKDLFVQKIASNVRMGQNIFLRFLPLFIKNIAVKIGYLLSYESHTTTLSNLGNISIPKKYAEYIDSFSVLINVANKEPFKCGICSFGNKLDVTFTSRHQDAYIQRAFFRMLSTDGLDVSIESNGVYYENL